MSEETLKAISDFLVKHDDIMVRGDQLQIDAITDSYEALASRVAELEGERREWIQKYNKLLRVAGHLHSPEHSNADTCKMCGLDIRNPIHYADDYLSCQPTAEESAKHASGEGGGDE